MVRPSAGAFFEFGKVPTPASPGWPARPAGWNAAPVSAGSSRSPARSVPPGKGRRDTPNSCSITRATPARVQTAPLNPQTAGPLNQQLGDLTGLPVVQLGPSTRMPATAQGWRAPLTGFTDPPAHRAPSDPQSRRHVFLLPNPAAPTPRPEAGGLPSKRSAVHQSYCPPGRLSHSPNPTLRRPFTHQYICNRLSTPASPCCLSVHHGAHRFGRQVVAGDLSLARRGRSDNSWLPPRCSRSRVYHRVIIMMIKR